MFYLEFQELIKTEYKDIKKYRPLIENEKTIFKLEKNESTLLIIWFCLSTIEAIDTFSKAFILLKKREYYKGWNELAQVEVIIHNIKYNIPDYSDYMAIKYLDQYTSKFQKIFPYKIFTSIVLVNPKEECSICGRSMEPFSGCEHIRGKVYAGELCNSIISDGDFIGMDFVEKPAMRCAVVFDDLDNPEKYKALEYLIPLLPNEYINWDVKITTEYEPHTNYNVKRNERCPCHSGKKYKQCCMKNLKGIKYDNYHFLLPDKLLHKNKKLNKNG
jgi:hypothetical protein